MSRTRRLVIPDGRPVSGRGRVALFEESRARAEREHEAHRLRTEALDRAMMVEVERLREAFELIKAHWPLTIPEEKRARCPDCSRRMIVDHAYSTFLWRCHVPGHRARPINRLRLAEYVRAQLAAEQPE